MRVKRSAYRPIPKQKVVVLDCTRNKIINAVIHDLRLYLETEFPTVKFKILNNEKYIWVETKPYSEDFIEALKDMVNSEFCLRAVVGVGEW